MAQLTDWISLDEGKQALNITGTSFDTELALYISAVSQRLDLLAGAAVIRTVTGELAAGDGRFIDLLYRPVAAITSVVEYANTTATTLAAETNSTKTADDYLLDATLGRLRRRSYGSDIDWVAGRGNIVVTYTAGRYANTAAVAEKYKLAASIYLTWMWRREQGAGSATFGGLEPAGIIPTFGVPNSVRDLLADEIVTSLA